MHKTEEKYRRQSQTKEFLLDRIRDHAGRGTITRDDVERIFQEEEHKLRMLLDTRLDLLVRKGELDADDYKLVSAAGFETLGDIAVVSEEELIHHHKLTEEVVKGVRPGYRGDEGEWINHRRGLMDLMDFPSVRSRLESLCAHPRAYEPRWVKESAA